MILGKVLVQNKGLIDVLKIRRGAMIYTPNGYRRVFDLKHKKIGGRILDLVLENSKIKLSSSIKVIKSNGQVILSRRIKEGDELKTRIGNSKVIKITTSYRKLVMVDLSVDSDYSSYYVNDLLIIGNIMVLPDKLNIG